MTLPIWKHEIEFIENTDGLVLHVMTGADEGLPLPPNGISVYAADSRFRDDGAVNERWVLCWVRMPERKQDTHPCEKCGEQVPVDEHCGNDRPDGTSEYLCPDCYVPLPPPTPEALAEEFRSVMQAWFKDEPESLLLIDKQNLAFLEQGHGDKYCATGDHCDSNQAMIDAWENLTGAEPELVEYEDEDLPLGSIHPDVTMDLINMAWGIAKRTGFAKEVTS